MCVPHSFLIIDIPLIFWLNFYNFIENASWKRVHYFVSSSLKVSTSSEYHTTLNRKLTLRSVQPSFVLPFPSLMNDLSLYLFIYFKATPTAYRSSQARGCVCDLHHSSRQCHILNPLSEAWIEPMSSWILVRLISAEPWWELLKLHFTLNVLFCIMHNS